MREEAGVFFSAKQPSTRPIRSFQRRVSTCAANLCMEKLFALCQHGGRDENVPPFTRSVTGRGESIPLRSSPPPTNRRTRCSTKFDRLSKGRGNNRNFSTMEPRISRLKRSFIRLSVCIERRSRKFQQMANSWVFLPLLSKLKRTP